MTQSNIYTSGMVTCEERINEERLSRKMLESCPPGRRKGRPQNSWMQKLTAGMREKGINIWNGSTGNNGK